MNINSRFVYYIIFCKLFAISTANVQSLCATNKLDNRCVCEYIKDDRHFPNLYANCKFIEKDRFPENGQFPNDLNSLDLSHNDISTLDSDCKYEDLYEFKISYNYINHIANAFFSGVPNLEVLDLSHNELSTLDSNVFTGVTKLIKLDLSFNKLTTLSDNLFYPLKNLQDVNLGYNSIGSFLSKHDNIFDSDFGLSENIIKLNLDRVDLKEVKNNFFGDTKTLHYLSLADNYLDDVPTIPTSLTYFDFSGNNVSTLSVRHLNYHGLKILKLNRLKSLESIDRYAFYNMQNLEELYMENCPRLREFNSMAFGVIYADEKMSLKKLSLARSGLRNINNTYFHLFKHLEYLNLQNNPWMCDCGIVWMHLLNGTFYKAENMRCISPTNLRNLKIMELTERSLPNCMMSSKSIRLQKLLVPILGVLVILLLSLIVYLIYMGPVLFRNYRIVGPESPYQDVTMLRDYQ